MEYSVKENGFAVEITGTCRKVPFYFRLDMLGWVFGASRLAEPKDVAYNQHKDDGGLYVRYKGKCEEKHSRDTAISCMLACCRRLESQLDANIRALKSTRLSPYEAKCFMDHDTWSSVNGGVIRQKHRAPRYME